MIIRAAAEADLEGILDIENWEIANNFAHFGITPIPIENLRRDFENARDKYPWFVAELETGISASGTGEGSLAGFARSGPWKTREAYAQTCEIGVYVRPVHHGKRVGNALYAALFPALKLAGFRTILAGIALPNPASVRLHESFGMIHFGTMHRVGYKFGQWWDVGYWELHWEG